MTDFDNFASRHAPEGLTALGGTAAVLFGKIVQDGLDADIKTAHRRLTGEKNSLTYGQLRAARKDIPGFFKPLIAPADERLLTLKADHLDKIKLYASQSNILNQEKLVFNESAALFKKSKNIARVVKWVSAFEQPMHWVTKISTRPKYFYRAGGALIGLAALTFGYKVIKDKL